MTETVPMGMDKFRYHLNLHNRFSPLASITGFSNVNPTEFQVIPQSLKMTTEDMDFGSGAFHRRQVFQHYKKTTENGKEIQIRENMLEKDSVFLSNSIDEIPSKLESRRCNIEKPRKFYFSKKRVKADARNASKTGLYLERSFRTGTKPQNRHMMFIGDCGLGISFTIKGHLKYGRMWKT